MEEVLDEEEVAEKVKAAKKERLTKDRKPLQVSMGRIREGPCSCRERAGRMVSLPTLSMGRVWFSDWLYRVGGFDYVHRTRGASIADSGVRCFSFPQLLMASARLCGSC